MEGFAAIEPVWTRAAVPLLGVTAFAALATIRQRRPTPGMPLFALTSVLGLWMFGVGLVWSKRWPSMIRWHAGWTGDPSSWEWTALFVIAGAVVLCVAAALRSFSSDRVRTGWTWAAVGLGLFAGWSAVVSYSFALALLAAGAATVALRAAAHGNGSKSARGLRRGLVIAAVTSLFWLWVIIAFLWWVVRGEGSSCGCWADNWHAWQYSGELLLALVGGAGLLGAGAGYLGRIRSAMVVGGAVAIAALGAWVALWVSARDRPSPRSVVTQQHVPVTAAATRAWIRQDLLVHRSHAARAAGREPAPDRSG